MNEIKKSVRRVYVRLFVLTAVVVFGAIAIAQAQKKKGAENAAQPPETLKISTKPLAISRDKQAAQVVTPAGAEEPMDEKSQIQWQEDRTELSVDRTTWSSSEGLPEPFDPGEQPSDTQQGLPVLPNQPYEPEAIGQDAESYADTEPYTAADTFTDTVPYADTEPTTDLEAYADSDRYTEAEPYLATDEVRAGANAAAYEDADPGTASDNLVPLDDQVRQLPGEEQPYSADSDPGLDPPTLPRAAAAPALIDNHPADYLPVDDTDEPAELPVSDAAIDAGQPRALPARPTSIPSRNPRLAMTNQMASNGRPGPRNLEGPQTPTFTVEKKVPAEIQVGKATKFEIRVRNVGRVAADNVVIRDEVPMGTEYVGSNPKATRDTDGAVYWQVGNIPPGEEVVVAMDLMPVEEGQIGSVATVSFEASATARTRATKPELIIEQTGPREVLLGDTVRFSIKLSNPGSGAATQVFIEEDVPVGLSHSTGSKLEYEVGTIQPGQTRHLELSLKAAQAGDVVNVLTARGAGDLVATDQVELRIVAPKLQVSMAGPSKRYLDRQATFSVSVANPGTAPAHDVEIVSMLPKGLKFVSTNNSGYYDQSRHAVIWSLEKLPAGEMGKAQFTAKPVEMGQYQIRTSGKARAGLESNEEHALLVEGIAALYFGLADQVDPLEVGGRSTYDIKVVNQGSKAATNVRFAALVPDGLTAVSAEGPTREQINGAQVLFEPIDRLAPKAEAMFRVMVQAAKAGDHRFRVQMSSDEMSTPVIKEESTRVYAD